MLPEMFRALTEKPETLSSGEKGISPFQAFAISAGSRVGTGNIAGVATAIVLGGPGAVFGCGLLLLLVQLVHLWKQHLRKFIRYMTKKVGSVADQPIT